MDGSLIGKFWYIVFLPLTLAGKAFIIGGSFLGGILSYLLGKIPLATKDPRKDPDMDNFLKLFVGGSMVGIVLLALIEIFFGAYAI